MLGANRYGKAENRVFRIHRDTARHEIHDLNVSTSLPGDFADAHITGDQSQVRRAAGSSRCAATSNVTCGSRSGRMWGRAPASRCSRKGCRPTSSCDCWVPTGCR